MDERDDDLILKPLEPDVIGEFYVLQCLLNINSKKDYSDLIRLFGEYSLLISENQEDEEIDTKMERK